MKKKQKKEMENIEKVNVVPAIEGATKEIFKGIEALIGKRKKKLTLGQRAADSLTKWAGSWFFIISFFIFIILWISANIYMWINQWDPYPFILLNLVLSCLAAVQAPIILMSQNRQSQKDRLKAEYDYQVNKRAEKEILEIKKLLQKKLR